MRPKINWRKRSAEMNMKLSFARLLIGSGALSKCIVVPGTAPVGYALIGY